MLDGPASLRLAPTKAKVLAEHAKRKGGKLLGDALDRRLNEAAGQRFHNHSPLDFEKLKGDPDNIDKHLVSYIKGFSANVRRIFDFFEFQNEILTNPPFGVDWKKQQKEIQQEHEKRGFDGRFGAGLPRVNDGSLLFLQHMIDKFEPVRPTEHKHGSRLAIVFSGSPLFTGGAGSGEGRHLRSRLRQRPRGDPRSVQDLLRGRGDGRGSRSRLQELDRDALRGTHGPERGNLRPVHE